MKLRKNKISLKIFFILSFVMFVFSIWIRTSDSSALIEIESRVNTNREAVDIFFCGKKIEKENTFLVDFNNRQPTKVSGSSPVSFFALKIKTENSIDKLVLAQDSNDPSLFWIYPYEEPSLLIDLGFMKSELLYQLSSNECSQLEDHWIYNYIPRNSQKE